MSQATDVDVSIYGSCVGGDSSPIVGEIQYITIANTSDHWSRGTIVVGGQNIIIPRNLLIDLPANRLTLQQLFTEAPLECAVNGETGLAKADTCLRIKNGAAATIMANRTNAGDIIAGEVFIAKANENVNGIVTFIDHTNGYLRINGIPNSANTGLMVRINDPERRHTVQQGPGCNGGPNCSADPRFALDPDNYTVTFTTGYPACLPSTVTGAGRTVGATPNGIGDPFCPNTNRAGNFVADSFKFSPIQMGDHISAEGNFEYIDGIYFLSAFSLTVHTGLTTATGQPDYVIFAEAEWDAAGFQNERVRGLFIGFTTLGDSQLDMYALHVNPNTNENQEFPLGATVGNPDTINQGIPPTDFGIFKIRYDVDFQSGVDDRLSPCVNLSNGGFTPARGGCAGGPTLDTVQNFRILSPNSREIIARSRNKVDNAIGDSVDIAGQPAPNGEYLTPVGVGHPEFVEIDLNRVQTPLIFAGEPWNLDRRLGPGGCDGACGSTPQPLDPFPFSGLDPRAQAAVPDGNRILTYFPNGLGGATALLAWPPQDPPAQGITPTPLPPDSCAPPPVGSPIATADSAATASDTPVTINLVANDTDSDGTIDASTLTIVASPANGTALSNGDGTVTYTPNATFGGTDMFAYTVKDNLGNVSNSASVIVEVTPPAGNVAPLAVNDTSTTTSGTAVTINVAANDSDPDGTLSLGSIAITTPPTNGVASSNGNGTVSYTSNQTFTGTETFAYTVRDNVGAVSNVATVTVTVGALQEILTVARAEFRIFKTEWRVEGTSTVAGAGNIITIYVGPTVGGTVLGTAVVDALGDWSFRQRPSTMPQATSVSIQSSRGTRLQNIPVVIRN